MGFNTVRQAYHSHCAQSIRAPGIDSCTRRFSNDIGLLSEPLLVIRNYALIADCLVCALAGLCAP